MTLSCTLWYALVVVNSNRFAAWHLELREGCMLFRLASSVISPMHQRHPSTLPWIPIGVNSDFDAGMPKLLRQACHWGMVFVQLDARLVTRIALDTSRKAPSAGRQQTTQALHDTRMRYTGTRIFVTIP